MADGIDPLMNAILDSRQPGTGILKSLAENAGASGGTHSRLMKRRREQLYADSATSTSFGTIIQDLNIVNEGGEAVTLSIIHPFALLEWLCQSSFDFFRLMHACMMRAQNGRMMFLLYQDGVTPGNNNRPDSARKFTSWLWSFAEMPYWLHELQWFVFSYVFEGAMIRADLTAPILGNAILHDLFKDPDRNFLDTGILLKHGEHSFTIRMQYEASPQDFAAHVELFDLKGPSGLAPCPSCENNLGRRDWFDDDSGIVHVLSFRHNQFKARTAANARAIVQKLKDLAAADAIDELDRLEMSSGIKYARHGILFAAELDDVVTFPDCVLYDLTHCMYSSGGINQYHVNQLIRVLVSGGACTIDTIDRFFAEVKQPKSWPGIKRGFVKGRMVDSPTAHMKGFASDTIAATYLLELFVDIFIQPQNIFLEEIQVLRKLSDFGQTLHKGR